MKKSILTGLLSPLFYCLVLNFVQYVVLAGEYNAKYSDLKNFLMVALPALPGVALIFLLKRNSLKEYFKSLGVYALISFIVMLVYIYSGVHWMIYRAVTGFPEPGLGDGLIFAITLISYLRFCIIGIVISFIITLVKRKKVLREGFH